MSKKLPSFEHVFVRHYVPEKRGDFDRVEPLLRAGFEHSSSTASSGMETLRSFQASDRWTIALEQATSNWILLGTNAASPRDLYQENRKSRRSEVAWVRHDAATGDYDFFWSSARKPIVELSYRSSEPEAWKDCESSESAVIECLDVPNADEAFQSLCRLAEVTVPAESVSVEGRHYQVVYPKGRRARKTLGKFVVFTAGGLAAGENDASDRLSEAIDAGDVTAVKQAISDGASLEKLPDRSLSPLVFALYRCGYTKEWRQCAQTLIDAGCSVNECKHEPLVMEACSHLLQENCSIEILKLLLENGADINASDKHGKTALDSSACYRRNNVVVFLIDHGADPTIKTRGDQTIIDEIRKRVEQSAEYGRRSEYAPTLELLTGERYEVPEIYRPSEAVRAEAERFLRIAEARQTRKVLLKEAEVQEIKASRLNSFPTFKPWIKELTQLGFLESCHMMVRVGVPLAQTLLTNEQLNFDAIVGDDGPFAPEGLRVEIVAYGASGDLFSATNKPTLDNPELRPSYIQSHIEEHASPSELVARLKTITATSKLGEIAARDGFERYRAGVQNLIDGMRKRTKEIERAAIVRPDGSTPRFERIGIYLQPRPGGDPEDLTSATVATSASESLTEVAQKANRRDRCDLIRDAAVLAALDHLEMAGALGDESKIAIGIDAGVEFFREFGSETAPGLDQWLVEPLCLAFALTASRRRWDKVQTIAEGLHEKFLDPSARFPDDPPVAFAEVLAMVANLFRRRPLRADGILRESIQASRSKHAQLLAQTLSSIACSDADAVKKTFTESLQHSIKRKVRPDWTFDLDRAVAWYETILWHTAKHRGMRMPKLTSRQRDWLLLPPQ